MNPLNLTQVYWCPVCDHGHATYWLADACCHDPYNRDISHTWLCEQCGTITFIPYHPCPLAEPEDQ